MSLQSGDYRNATGWWNRNAAQICDIVEDPYYEFAIFGTDAYIVGFGAILTCALTAVTTHCWTPKRVVLRRESLEKFLDNTILLSALMVAFALGMPAAVGYDDLIAADTRATMVNSQGIPCPQMANVFWGRVPPSEAFLRKAMSAVLYLATTVLWCWLSHMSLSMAGDVDDDVLTKVWIPQIPYIAYLLVYGIIQFVYTFIFYISMIAPLYTNRMYMNLWAMFGAAFSVFPAIVMKATQAKRQKRSGGNQTQTTVELTSAHIEDVARKQLSDEHTI